MENVEERQVEMWNDMEIMKNIGKNGKCEMIWKKYGRKASWNVKRYGQYGRKASWIEKIWKIWKKSKLNSDKIWTNMEERQVE